MSDQPCSCVCMAENIAIVATEKFYKISLEHPAMIGEYCHNDGLKNNLSIETCFDDYFV